MFVEVVAERFLSQVVNKYVWLHSISSEDDGTWYPFQACHFLKLKHHIHILLYMKMKKALLKEQYAISKGQNQRMLG
jgi:hypothetical protein